MISSSRRLTQRPPLGAPSGRRAAWLFAGLLITASAVGSFTFACATPFAALAVAAAGMLTLRPALLTITDVWALNQAIGYGLLAYPVTTNSLLWGGALGIAALLATLAAAGVFRGMPRWNAVAAAVMALVASFVAYEIALFAASLALGGADDFAPAIIGQIAMVNALWTVGLMAASEVWRWIAAARQIRSARA
jgi:hypothetical protein